MIKTIVCNRKKGYIILCAWLCMRLENAITIMQVDQGNYQRLLWGIRCRSRNCIMGRKERTFSRCMKVIGVFRAVIEML
jgi:hypothetical protein